MKATVVVTNPRFRHVSHSFNRPANNTEKKTKTLLANTAFLCKKRAGRGLTAFFPPLMLTLKKFHQYLARFSREKLRIRVNWYDRPWENKTNKKPFCSALHRAVTRTRKNVTLKPCLHSIFNQKEEDGGLWFL